MRRCLLAAVFAMTVLLGAGCDGSQEPSAAPSGAVSSSSGAGAGNTKQVCAEAKALGEEYRKKATEILTRALQTAATDETKSEQILAEIVPLSKEYKTKFEALAKTADNQQLKDALTTLAKDMDNATGETAGEAVGAAEETLTGVCGA
jgi:hypothetical protein